MASLGEGGTKVGPAYFRSARVKKLDSANHVMAMELEPAWDILIPEVDDLNPLCSNPPTYHTRLHPACVFRFVKRKLQVGSLGYRRLL